MKEAEERGFRDLPEGQAWGEATRDGNVGPRACACVRSEVLEAVENSF